MLEFDYRLVGSGWSEARLADANGHVMLSASYLSDALRDLLEAVALIVEGAADERRCSWDEEPGEYRWVFRRESAQNVRVRVLWFDELWGDEPDLAGEVKFETSVDPFRLGRVVLAAAQRVLDEHGEDGYLRAWVQHPYPMDALTRLRSAVKRES